MGQRTPGFRFLKVIQDLGLAQGLGALALPHERVNNALLPPWRRGSFTSGGAFPLPLVCKHGPAGQFNPAPDEAETRSSCSHLELQFQATLQRLDEGAWTIP